MKRISFTKASFWLSLVVVIMGIAVLGCDDLLGTVTGSGDGNGGDGNGGNGNGGDTTMTMLDSG